MIWIRSGASERSVGGVIIGGGGGELGYWKGYKGCFFKRNFYGLLLLIFLGRMNGC